MSYKIGGYKGIDYAGHTTVNRDVQTGIRYGVISANEVCQAWYDSAEADYGEPHCPKCGDEVKAARGLYERYEHAKYGCDDYVCHKCKYVFDNQDAFGESPNAWTLDDGEYKAEQGGEDRDIFVIRSPYFTYAQFCSPCAPGAVYLLNPCTPESCAPRGYCFGPEWFEGGVAPYPVYEVETGELITPVNSSK